MAQAHPFVKWAGGKTQLVPTLLDILPKKIQTYYEPFTGGGALFYALAPTGRFQRAVLNDWNFELVTAYKSVRDFPDELITALKALKVAYEAAPRETFEEWRSKDATTLDPVARAARMLFLNRTCFNGLYRVNKSGGFNVPFGKYTNPTICDEENLRACSALLEKWATVRQGDFADACADAGPGDVVYFDPPYVPLTPTSDFTSYTSNKFGLESQQRLATLFRSLYERGVAVVASNSDTEIVRSLYEGFELHEVRVKRTISAKAATRGAVGELIVVGRRGSKHTEIPNAWTTHSTIEVETDEPDEDEEIDESLPDPLPEARAAVPEWRPPFDLDDA